MPISKPHSTLGASNTSSCSDLAKYLEKENEAISKMQDKTTDFAKILSLENRKQFFFNHSKDDISTNEVISSIDSNTKKLGKNDAKYFAPTISFSSKELEYLIWKVKKNKKVESVSELSKAEYVLFNNLIKEYARKVMSNYAENFNRQGKGLKSGSDLVYFGKVEHFRKFKGTDVEVIKGRFKAGDFKPGFNSHLHIIVSRKDKTQKMKLTPTTKEKSTTRTIGGNSYHVGFDRMKWINMNEKTFDSHFKYKRSEMEKFKNQYILKNGTPKEKHDLLNEIQLIENSIKKEQKLAQNKPLIKSQQKLSTNVKKNSNNPSKGRRW